MTIADSRYVQDVHHLLMREGIPMDSDYPKGAPYAGWSDYEALRHVRAYGDGCEWRLVDDAPITENTYSMFEDTESDNRIEHGIESGPASCACGRYSNVTLRYVGTLTDMLRKLGLRSQPAVVKTFPDRSNSQPEHRIRNTVQRGQQITLPRGTAYRHRGQVRHLRRANTITVHSVSDGWVNSIERREGFGFVHLPTITWAGSGGYWSDVKLTPELAHALGVPEPIIDPAWNDPETGEHYRLDVIPAFGPGYDNRDVAL